MRTTTLETRAKGRSEEIARFWAALPPAERRRLGEGARREAFVIGRFEEELPREDELVDYYEYLVNHEIFLVDRARAFHVCAAHAKARAALARGVVAASFVCPLARTDCPMTNLVHQGEGRHVRLRLAVLPSCEERDHG